jgi:potassium/chloride transporter 4/5/6
VVSTCLEGALNTHNFHEKEQARKALHRQMNEEKVKGFCSVLITKSVSEGISHLIQTAGLGKFCSSSF